jgi:5-methylcytosine-specific restriction endonuclease McrA
MTAHLHTPSRKSLFAKYGGRCAYCGKPLPKNFHRDHKEPIIRFKNVRYTFSGRNGCKHPANHKADNLVAACAHCNLDKGNMDLATWRGSLRWLGWQNGIVFWFERYEHEEGADHPARVRRT